MSKKREMIIKRGDTTFDKILAHHRNPEAFELSPKEEELLDRWRLIFHLKFNHYNTFEIVAKLEKEGLSKSQAYNDIKSAESLFGNVLETNKEFERALFIAGTKDFLKRCIQKGDRNNEAKARLLLGKFGNFAEDKDPTFNPEKLANVEIRIDVDPRQLEALDKFTNKGVQNFNNLNVIDIEHEDLEDDASPE